MALYNKFFYNEVIRKYVIVFGHLFSDIQVIRKNKNGEEIRREHVPLTYAPKEKFIARLEQDYAEERKVAIKLPHMAFEIVGYAYSPGRKLSSYRKMIQRSDTEEVKFQYNPVPYDIDFDLHIFTKTQEEGLQIIEQITPFFTPSYTLTANLLKDMPDCRFDLPVSLQSVVSQDTYEGNFEERRSIEWTLSFRMNAWLFGPTRTSGIILNTVMNAVVSDVPIEEQPVIKQNNLPSSSTFNTIEGIDGTIFDTNEGVNIPFDKDGDGNSDLENINNEGEQFYTITKNTDFAFLVEVRDDSDKLFDLAGGTTRAKFRKNLSDPNPVDILATITDIGIIRVDVPAASTASIDEGIYVFDVFYDTIDGSTIKLVQGKFYIR